MPGRRKEADHRSREVGIRGGEDAAVRGLGIGRSDGGREEDCVFLRIRGFEGERGLAFFRRFPGQPAGVIAGGPASRAFSSFLTSLCGREYHSFMRGVFDSKGLEKDLLARRKS